MRLPCLSLVLCAAALGGCSPTFNWREARHDEAGLRFLLPCKPDAAAREVPLAGQAVRLQMQGCEAGGATFAVAAARLADAAQAGRAVADWRAALLATLHTPAPVAERAQPVQGAPAPGQRLQLEGRQANSGQPAHAQALWFGRGEWVFQAVLIEPPTQALPTGVADSFFEGLQLR